MNSEHITDILGTIYRLSRNILPIIWERNTDFFGTLYLYNKYSSLKKILNINR